MPFFQSSVIPLREAQSGKGGSLKKSDNGRESKIDYFLLRFLSSKITAALLERVSRVQYRFTKPRLEKRLFIPFQL